MTNETLKALKDIKNILENIVPWVVPDEEYDPIDAFNIAVTRARQAIPICIDAIAKLEVTAQRENVQKERGE